MPEQRRKERQANTAGLRQGNRGQRSPAPITSEQVWRARGLLGWSRDRLSGKSDVSYGFIVQYERNGVVGVLFSRERGFDGLVALRTTFEREGLQFSPNGRGVEARKLALS